MADTIDNTMDIIDSRDVIARLEELRGMAEAEDEAEEELSLLENAGCQDEDEIEAATLAVEEAQDDLDEFDELAGR